MPLSGSSRSIWGPQARRRGFYPGKGTSIDNPATSGIDVLNSWKQSDLYGENAPPPPSGNYWIKPSNYTGSPILLWCDMSNLGGGWVLIGKGRQSSDSSGGWFSTNNEINTSGLRNENAFSSGVSKVSASFVNYLMNGTSSGWQNSNNNNYLVVNRISNATDGYQGVGDSLYFKVTNQSAFSWINQFGTSGSQNNSAAITGTGVNKRYNGIWHTLGQFGSQATTFADVDYGGGNGTNRSFTWWWSGHGSFHGWSSGQSELRGFQASTEGHAIQFIQLWAR